MKFQFDTEDLKEIDGIKARVEANSKQMDEIVDSIISDYTKDLDNYVDFIRGLLADGQNPPTDVELDDFVMNLSTYIYFARDQCTTQAFSGGLTESYLDNGTYVKSFYTVMNCPSCVKVATMGVSNKRYHHIIDWEHAVPKIISGNYAKGGHNAIHN